MSVGDLPVPLIPFAGWEASRRVATVTQFHGCFPAKILWFLSQEAGVWPPGNKLSRSSGHPLNAVRIDVKTSVLSVIASVLLTYCHGIKFHQRNLPFVLIQNHYTCNSVSKVFGETYLLFRHKKKEKNTLYTSDSSYREKLGELDHFSLFERNHMR